MATFGVGLILTLWLGEQYTPTLAFALIGTIITGAILPIYIAVNIVLHRLLLAGAPARNSTCSSTCSSRYSASPCSCPAFFTGLGIPVFKFISKLTYPLDLAGIVIAAWYALGIVLLIYFSIRHPDRIRDTRKVFIESDEPQLAETPSA